MTAGPRRSSLNSEKSVSPDDDKSRRRSGSLREVEDSSMQDVARGSTESPRTSKKGSISVSRSVTKKDKVTSPLREGSSHTRFEVHEPSRRQSSHSAANESATPSFEDVDMSSVPADPPPPPPSDPPLSTITSQPLHDYREPEAVPEFEVPPSYQDTWGETTASNTGWGAADTTTGWDAFITREDDDDDVDAYMPPITNWWSASSKTHTPSRPGPGFLPPLLENDLHLDSLFLVKILEVPERSVRSPEDHISPTLEDVHASMPSRLFYSKDDHGWKYIRIIKDASLSLLRRLHDAVLHPPLPAPNIRSRRIDCSHLDAGPATGYGPSRPKTHHFHFYPAIVDSAELPDDPIGHLHEPLLTSGGVALEHSGYEAMDEDTASSGENIAPRTEKGYSLDAYVCGLCSVYVVVSRNIPAVVPVAVRNALTIRLQRNPPIGMSSMDSALRGWELVIRVLEDWVFDGKSGPLNVRGTAFQSRLGWNHEVEDVFKHVGFSPARREDTGEVSTIKPPSASNPMARGALLRAWIELSAYISALRLNRSVTANQYTPRRLYAEVQSVRDIIASSIGSAPNQMRRNYDHPGKKIARIHKLYKVLGMTPDTHSEYWLRFAYKQQLRCDPIGIPEYLQAFKDIAEIPGVSDSESLSLFVQTEKSKEYWLASERERALMLLGFGENGPLRIEFDENDVDGQFLMNAYVTSWNSINANFGPGRPEERDVAMRDLRDAVLITAQSTGREDLVGFVQEELRKRGKDPAQAYVTLGANHEMDDDLILVIFGMRIQDEPAQQTRWNEALETIAHHRDSSRLKAVLETGVDPGGAPVAIVKPEWPRGLHQLGNTCYLNSLLQYFYTIKDLRDALSGGVYNTGATIKDEELKATPIGGRIITSHELTRSRRFVAMLNELFVNLACAEAPAVLPEIELAKLALMTSKDEEAESHREQEANGTSTGSADTDSTLVETQIGPQLPDQDMQAVLPSSPFLRRTSLPMPQSPISILGKRSSEEVELDHNERRSPMEVDTVPASNTQQGNVFTQFVTIPENDVEMENGNGNTAAVRPQALPDAGPPPLPPRRRTEGVGEMMFGKQNDVAECMDNCMFQIECALQFDQSRKDSKKQNVVKQLFYGKSQQQIWPDGEPGKSQPSVSVKEDIFAQLLVNVSDDGLDIYDGLSHFLDDTVEFEGRQAEMEIDILELPPILQIQLQRVQFDRETLQARKNNSYVKFDETLRMDRFLDAIDAAKKAQSRIIRNNLRRCRARIAALSQSPGGTVSDTLSSAKDLLSGNLATLIGGVDAELNAYLDSEKEHVGTELERCRTEARSYKEELEQLWAESTGAEYELCSVFIHRGTSPSWGHYFFYSRDLPNNPDQWYKYNDSEVTLVGRDEIFKDTTGSTANPYLLVYSRKGANVIDTVHRLLPSA